MRKRDASCSGMRETAERLADNAGLGAPRNRQQPMFQRRRSANPSWSKTTGAARTEFLDWKAE
jgi:hypothetical protein